MDLKVLQQMGSFVLALCTVILLLAAFILHAIQIPHGHHVHEVFSVHDDERESSAPFSILGEYMHAADKKLFWLIASIFGLLVALPSFLHTFSGVVSFSFTYLVSANLRRRTDAWSSRGFIGFLFSIGILNPKLY